MRWKGSEEDSQWGGCRRRRKDCIADDHYLQLRQCFLAFTVVIGQSTHSAVSIETSQPGARRIAYATPGRPAHGFECH